MQLPLWIAACVALAIVLRNRPTLYITAMLALWLLVPAVGSPTLTGRSSGPLSYHADTWLILAVALVQLLHHPEPIFAVIRRHIYLFLVLLLVIGAAVLATLTNPAGGGTVVLVDQIIAPVLVFLLVVAAGARDRLLVGRLKYVLLTLVGLNAVVALAQWATHNVLFYAAGFGTQYWFKPNLDRWMGLLDQPLALSMVVCAVAPLIAGIRRVIIQIPLLLLFAMAVVISQSRTGMVAFAAVVLYVVLFSRLRTVLKIVTFAVLTAAALVIASSPLIDGLQQRVADDTGSTQARGAALDFFVSNWTRYIFAGDGVSASYGVAQQAGLASSLESPILMYSVDIGIVFALLYFGVLAVLVCRNLSGNGVKGLALAGLLAFLIPQTYSSLATRSAVGILMWTVVAMLVVAGDHAGDRVPARAILPWRTTAPARGGAPAAVPAGLALFRRPAWFGGGPAVPQSVLPSVRGSGPQSVLESVRGSAPGSGLGPVPAAASFVPAEPYAVPGAPVGPARSQAPGEGLGG